MLYNENLKNTQICYITKINAVGAKLLGAERRTDMTKLNSHFLQFYKHAKKLDHMSLPFNY